MNHLVLGSRTVRIESARLGLSPGKENFVLELWTAGDGVSRRIGIFGYCEPALPRRDAITDCELWTAVEDSADVFDLEIAGVKHSIAPMSGRDGTAVLAVEVVDDAHVILRYRGTFLAADPTGVRDDVDLDADLEVTALWPAD